MVKLIAREIRRARVLHHLPCDTNGNNVPTALIAGKISPANQSNFARLIGLVVAGVCPQQSPLGLVLTIEGWNGVFNGRPNDGAVSVDSQFALKTGNYLAPAAIHSAGLLKLGFKGPTEVEALSGIPAKVLELLNSPAKVGAAGGVFVTLP
jgi:hypothetical protein